MKFPPTSEENKMTGKDEIQEMLLDLESDRVERTVSTTNLVVVKLSENAVRENSRHITDVIPSKADGINDGINDGIKRPVVTDLHKAVYQTICMKPTIRYTELADNIGVSESSITRAIRELKEYGYIARHGARKSGEWIILKRLE